MAAKQRKTNMQKVWFAVRMAEKRKAKEIRYKRGGLWYVWRRKGKQRKSSSGLRYAWQRKAKQGKSKI